MNNLERLGAVTASVLLALGCSSSAAPRPETPRQAPEERVDQAAGYVEEYPTNEHPPGDYDDAADREWDPDYDDMGDFDDTDYRDDDPGFGRDE